MITSLLYKLAASVNKRIVLCTAACVSFVALLFVAFAAFCSPRSAVTDRVAGELQGHSPVVPLATAPLDVSVVEI